MSIKKFGDIQVVRASALAQMEELSLLSAPIIVRWSSLSKPVKDPVDDFLLLFLTSLPFPQKKKIVDLLMSEMSRDGEYVDAETFNGRLVEFHKLMAQVVHWNLDDFFTYIDNAHKSDLSKLNKIEEA